MFSFNTLRVALIAAGTCAGARLVTPEALGAQVAPTDTSIHVAVGGFIDTYYAWDTGKPSSHDRSFAGGVVFTTQPSRHNEFNVNLAFVELKLDAPHYRGRLAVQTGTSVQSNYAGEPNSGTVSGPSLSRILQEAVVGVQIRPTLWADAGVMLSHVGMESWISRDNPTYTRSLVADYSPYYQSGAKLTWNASSKVTAQLDIVNGWQTIAENNQGKGAGVRVDVQADSATLLSYYNLFSQESGTRLRTFNGAGLKRTKGRWSVLGEFDYGTQSRGRDSTGTSSWMGGVAVVRVQSTPKVALSARVEAYSDPDQVIIATGQFAGVPNGAFRGSGASIGVDVTPYARVYWRTELRGWHTRDAIFPSGNSAARRNSAVAVSSLALTF